MTILSTPGPKILFSGPGCKTSRGRVQMQLGCFCPKNLYVEMVKTIVKPVESKHFGIFKIWGGSFASIRSML